MGIFNLLQEPGRQTLEEQNCLLNNLFGTQNYDGDFHYNGFTEIVIRHLLKSTGFNIISLEVLHEWLFHILERDIDSEGMNFYMNRLKLGTLRESVVNALKGSDEYLKLQSKV